MTSPRTWYPLTGAVTPVRAGVAAAPKKKGPVDPLTGPKLALAGRVVTMDDAFTVRADGIVYVDKGRIVAVQDRAQPAPGGFEGVPVVETGGTLFPGLIELHNHLSYNALPLWAPVPKRFEHRGQWPDHKDYRPLISGPMTVIGEYRDASGQPALLPALVRYVECKCLLGGVTTSQGVKLASNAGIQRFYRGIVRNVEQTDDPGAARGPGPHPRRGRQGRPALPDAAREGGQLLPAAPERGRDRPEPARLRGPAALPRPRGRARRVGPQRRVHRHPRRGPAAARTSTCSPGEHGSMVWSPLSNLLLYGGTARVDAARAAGVRIGLGSDWSPTGSKNLLGELKVAWLYSQHALNGLFTARDLVAMATRDAARILKWGEAVGTLDAGKRADLLVIAGTAGDPYDALIRAKETDLLLVMINGIARYGVSALMAALAPEDQTVRVGGQSRRLFLKQETADPDVAAVSLSAATASLRDALHDIAKLAKEAETPKPAAARKRVLDAPARPVWSLALDEIQDRGVDLRPRLPFNGPRDFTGPERAMRGAARASPPLSTILKPIQLDPLTVADDEDFLNAIEQQPNVPSPIKNGLRGLY